MSSTIAVVITQYVVSCSATQEENRHQTERQPSPEARTTDSGYISPPEIMSNEQDIHKQSHEGKDGNVIDNTCSKESGNCDKHMTTDLDEVDDKYFDSFLYWRTPLPQVELDTEDLAAVEKVKTTSDKLTLTPEASAISEGETSRSPEMHHHSNAIHQHHHHHHHHPKLSFMNGDDDSDEEDGIPLYSLTDDFHSHMDHGIGRFDYDDYRKLSLAHTSSFDEDLLIADHITAPPVQVRPCHNPFSTKLKLVFILITLLVHFFYEF